MPPGLVTGRPTSAQDTPLAFGSVSDYETTTASETSERAPSAESNMRKASALEAAKCSGPARADAGAARARRTTSKGGWPGADATSRGATGKPVSAARNALRFKGKLVMAEVATNADAVGIAGTRPRRTGTGCHERADEKLLQALHARTRNASIPFAVGDTESQEWPELLCPHMVPEASSPCAHTGGMVWPPGLEPRATAYYPTSMNEAMLNNMGFDYVSAFKQSEALPGVEGGMEAQKPQWVLMQGIDSAELGFDPDFPLKKRVSRFLTAEPILFQPSHREAVPQRT